MTSRPLAASLALTAALAIVTSLLLIGEMSFTLDRWLLVVVMWGFSALGWLLAARRPELRYGWLLLAAGLSFGLGVLGAGLEAAGAPLLLHRPLSSMYVVFYGLILIYVPLLFPDGRLPAGRRWRVVAWISGAAVAAHLAGISIVGSSPAGPDLHLVPMLAAGLGQFVTWIMAVVVFCGLVARWRRAKGERGQYAMMVAGHCATLVGVGALATAIVSDQLISPVAGSQGVGATGILGATLLAGSLPAALLVAVVRHRLLDIRVGVRGSRLHMVFDLRPTVDEVLSDLGTALEDAPEPVEQLGRLAAAVRSGLELSWAAVVLPDGTRVVAGREDGEPVLVVPVNGGPGRIECGPKITGPLTRVDRRLLDSLAVPAGLAIQSAGLVTRLVNAQEVERRRIERNIHDGVQQQLVALIAGLELARAVGAADPGMLSDLREQARQTLTDLRELAAGIHPSSLSEGGLVEAVEERCSRLPVRTTVISSPSLRARRFADEVEGAMYFTVSESVANALKHAEATEIEVRLTHDDGRLRATVTDDGKGFDTGATGRRGLATLADRLDALGGGLTVDSAPGEGTRVNAWVPADG
ncbi:Histidine kinase-, DNA gyrase B-, and HSP90-like ATPase [Nonomuraea maritima]|uniref:histidine kinase n=1 Tax=Nonomuraea maritima TaxID=683260 RepID=A0A1G8V0S9_9ACTN|nr:ATP-binding protein [Nonomuraea maritima]SDJ59681.1 Histidine kinase-, DNA gyrase B-, and HSP90-like ATPase [Nonomuraea maritima]